MHSRPHFFALAATCLAPVLSAQGTITSFGGNCGHVGGPDLSLMGSPEPGATLTVEASNLLAGAGATLLIGLSDSSSAFGPLPLALPTPPFGQGCTLFVSTELQVPMAGSGGTASASGVLPPGASDYHLYFQAYVTESFGELNLTQALDVHVLAPPTGTGDLSGLVTLQSGGAPVADARVTLFTPDLAFFSEERTATDGSYAFPAVPAGGYRLGVAAPGLEYQELPLALAPGAQTQDFSLEPETHPGAWQTIGDTLPETFDATDIGVLRPDGTILYCHDTTDPIVFDPVALTKALPPSSGSEQGCMNSTLLAGGEAILVGGQQGADPGSFVNAIPWVKLFQLAGGWLQLGDMLAPNGRWYPGLARLNDGRLLVMGGGTAPSAERTDTCEVFDPTTQTWNWTGTMGSAVEFPPSALLYDGLVLRTWGTEPELYDPQTEVWTPTGSFAFPDRGYPGHSDHSLLVLTDGRAAAIGINASSQPGAAMVEYYDPAAGDWAAGSSPAQKRGQCEVVYLPDGQILVQGGDKYGAGGPEPDVLGIVRRCDLLDPVANSWRRVADSPLFREYHAVTLLIPDGRVVTTGGTLIKFSGQNPVSADIDAYSPPYLFRGVRPQISNLSSSTPTRGATLSFDVFPQTALTGAVLMGVQSTTHWVDGGIPRRLELGVAQSGSQAQLTLPSDPDLLPVGWYLLFGMVDDIPSEALFVRVDP